MATSAPAMSAPATSRGGIRLRAVTYNAGAIDPVACTGDQKENFRKHLTEVVQGLVKQGAQLIGIQELNQEHGNWFKEPCSRD